MPYEWFCEWNGFIETSLRSIENAPLREIVDTLIRERVEQGAVVLYDKRRGRSQAFIKTTDGRSFTVELVTAEGKRPWIHSIELDPEDI